MQENSEKKSLFQQFWEKVQIGHSSAMKERIVQECGISRATWASWVSGRSMPDTENQLIIHIVAQQSGYDTCFFDGNAKFKLDENKNIVLA